MKEKFLVLFTSISFFCNAQNEVDFFEFKTQGFESIMSCDSTGWTRDDKFYDEFVVKKDGHVLRVKAISDSIEVDLWFTVEHGGWRTRIDTGFHATQYMTWQDCTLNYELSKLYDYELNHGNYGIFVSPMMNMIYMTELLNDDEGENYIRDWKAEKDVSNYKCKLTEIQFGNQENPIYYDKRFQDKKNVNVLTVSIPDFLINHNQ